VTDGGIRAVAHRIVERMVMEHPAEAAERPNWGQTGHGAIKARNR
jgi:hypothetical protein